MDADQQGDVAVNDPNWIERDVPVDLRLALGDLVIAAADVEHCIYEIALIFRIERPELKPAKRVSGLLQGRVGDLGVPPWSDVSRPKLTAWCGAARGMLEHRDRLIHAGMYFRGTIDGGMEVERFSLRDGQNIESAVEHVRLVVTQLLRVRRAGIITHHSLLFPGRGGGRMVPPYIGDPLSPVWHAFEVPTTWSEWIAGAASRKPLVAPPPGDQ
ncbi:hypothetical protein [Isoptericola sp. NPDC056134]|uniref:hypothetical protein n=1 Tax=Isoptericola sp. NPDC056134 TaxID=3345723 RepID=UPI0035E930B6